MRSRAIQVPSIIDHGNEGDVMFVEATSASAQIEIAFLTFIPVFSWF